MKKMKFKNYKLVDPIIGDQGIIKAFVSIFGVVDSYGEVVDQGAFADSLRERMPKGVWSHNWDQPIAKTLVAEEILPGDPRLPEQIRDKGGLYIEGQLVLGVQKAAEAYELIKAGAIDEFSIGYFEEGDYTDAEGNRHLSKIKLHEWSPVLVGANPETFLVGIKAAIPYADHGMAPEDTEWDGPGEMAACGDDMMKLKEICAWYDSENADVKSSYKLPHHQAEGLKAVWRGVSAAMAALLGARGGVQLPDADRQAVYNHLAKHYAEFEKDAPEFKQYSDEELKAIEEGTGLDEKTLTVSKSNRKSIEEAIGTLTAILKTSSNDNQDGQKGREAPLGVAKKKVAVKTFNAAIKALLAEKKALNK